MLMVIIVILQILERLRTPASATEGSRWHRKRRATELTLSPEQRSRRSQRSRSPARDRSSNQSRHLEERQEIPSLHLQGDERTLRNSRTNSFVSRAKGNQGVEKVRYVDLSCARTLSSTLPRSPLKAARDRTTAITPGSFLHSQQFRRLAMLSNRSTCNRRCSRGEQQCIAYHLLTCFHLSR